VIQTIVVSRETARLKIKSYTFTIIRKADSKPALLWRKMYTQAYISADWVIMAQVF